MMDPVIITRRLRNVKRIREIINILIKHGFGFVVESLGLTPLIRIRRRFRRKKSEKYKPPSTELPGRLRALFEELGPTFIKFGQMLTTRPDILELKYIKELNKLLDETSPLPFNKVSPVLREELGEDWRGNFEIFNTTAYKSASLSQVHIATLKDGKKVAVKIQRPDLKRIVERDLSILKDVAQLVENRITEFQRYEPVRLVNELAITIKRELDFNREAVNSEHLKAKLKDDESVKIPEVYWDYTTKRVLITEFIEGNSLLDILSGKTTENFNKEKIAENLLRLYFNQIFNLGVFHADPHPGNIIIAHDGRITLVDCGILGILDEETKDRLALIIFGILRRDYQLVAKEYLRLGYDEEVDSISRFRRDITYAIERWYDIPLKNIHLESIIDEINNITHMNNLKIPSDMLLFIKTVGTVEGISRSIKPDINPFKVLGEPIEKLLKSRVSADVLINKSFRILTDILYIVENFPENMTRLVQKLIKGKIRMIFKHEGLDNLTKTINITSTRLSISFIIGSLIIGSSYIISADIGPKIFNLPLIGSIGYILALLLGFWMLLNIFRS